MNANATTTALFNYNSIPGVDEHNNNKEEEKKEPTSCAPANGNANKKNNAVCEESEMRGVHAVHHIPPNTVCMSIPRRCLIMVEMGQATEIGQAILRSNLDLDAPKHIFLMIYILWDRKVNGPNSFFFPYYEILPQTLHNMPIFWTSTELDELRGSYLLHQIADRNQAISDDYSAICAICPSLTDLCTLAEFKWARMCVCSRNFGLQIDGHRTSAMVPHADMLNHYRPRETKWTFEEERQAFTITALQPIVAGAEVLDSYGQKCNHRFLLNYGFAVEDNRELDGFCPNEVPLELTLDVSDEFFQERLEFWVRGEHFASVQGENDGYDDDDDCFVHHREQVAASVLKRVRVCESNNENTRLLWSLLRTLAFTRDELLAVSQPNANNNSTLGGGGSAGTKPTSLFGLPDVMLRQYQHQQPPQQQQQQPRSPPAVVLTASPAPVGATYHRSCRDIRHPISLRNEIAALHLLHDLVVEHLSRYPTTLQQDLQALANESEYPKFSNRRHAKIQVRGEKEVLHHFLAWAETGLQVLGIIGNELKREADKHNGGCEPSSFIEVQWRGGNQNGNHIRMQDEQHEEDGAVSFDAMIRHLEETGDEDDGVHHTILRYCADTLGSLRREEFKNLRRKLNQRSAAANRRAPPQQQKSRGGSGYL
jgi:Rubisco LSMT substrate-binding/SET domain